MWSSMKTSQLLAVVVVLVAVIAGATVLAWKGVLSGSDWLVIATTILAGVIGVSSAHVAGQTAAAAINVTPPNTPASPPTQTV